MRVNLYGVLGTIIAIIGFFVLSLLFGFISIACGCAGVIYAVVSNVREKELEELEFATSVLAIILGCIDWGIFAFVTQLIL